MRHILYFLRERGAIYRDGKDIESLIKEEAFLDFHDGYIFLSAHRDSIFSEFRGSGKSGVIEGGGNSQEAEELGVKG